MAGGGAERQLTYLCKETVQRGIDVHVALLRGGPNLERLEKSGATIHWITATSNYDPLIFVRLVSLIRELNPDIVQTWLTQLDVFGGAASLWLGKPFVLSEVCNALAYTTGWKDSLRLWIGKRANFITSISDGGRDYWLSHGKPSGQIQVIGNAIPFHEVEEFNASCSEKMPSQNNTIVFAGRYEAQKNLEVLVEAFRQVLNRVPSANVRLIGRGSMREFLIDFCEKHNLSDRMVVGDYTDQLWTVLKYASVFVNASVYEGVPNTILEAAVLGCPLVLSDIQAHREIFDDESACFVPVSSPEAIADGIIATLSSREAAKEKSKKAIQAISRFSPQTVAEQYHRLYEHLIFSPVETL